MDQRKKDRVLVLILCVCLLLAAVAVAALVAVHNAYRSRLNEQALQARPGAAANSGMLGGMPAAVVTDEPEEPEEGDTAYCMTAFPVSCYSEADPASPILDTFSFGDRLVILGTEGDCYRCRLSDGGEGFVLREYFTPRSYEYPLVYVPGARDLRSLIPDAEFDLLFAGPDNIAGHAMYAPIPILEDTTAELLLQAAEAFRLRGYRLKIYDSYRPKRAQFELYDIVHDSRYIANPYVWGSWHNYGRAVDLSLIDLETGEELDMPTPMHTFRTLAARGSRDRWTEEQRANVDMMTEVMRSVGFNTIETEWWHFEYTGEGAMLEDDMVLDSGDYYNP